VLWHSFILAALFGFAVGDLIGAIRLHRTCAFRDRSAAQIAAQRRPAVAITPLV